MVDGLVGHVVAHWVALEVSHGMLRGLAGFSWHSFMASPDSDGFTR